MGFFEDTIRALNEASVRYVVVGGLAVVLHGHIRATYDLDLIVDLSPEEARRAMDALTALGLRPKVPVDAAQFADPSARRRWIEDKGMTVLSFWDPNNAARIVDVFVEEPIDFVDLWARSVVVPLESTEVRIAAIPDLIELKRRAGRPQDLLDLETLETMLRSGMRKREALTGWEQNRRDQLQGWMSATPAQRLAALEELIALARGAEARFKRSAEPSGPATA